MDRGLYIAMTGASQNMLAQRAHANNLANASTTGFRADFVNAVSKPVYGGVGFDSRVYSLSETPGIDFSIGPTRQTGRDLDMVVAGEGWIAVRTPDGREAYTRGGSLSVDVLGVLRNEKGLEVLGNGGPIAIPDAEKIEIGTDGTISVRALGQSAQTLVEIDRIKLVSPDQQSMYKAEDGLIYSKDPVVPDPSIRVKKGFLENSNVNPVNELMKTVSLARQFEMQVSMMQTLGDNASTAARVLQVAL